MQYNKLIYFRVYPSLIVSVVMTTLDMYIPMYVATYTLDFVNLLCSPENGRQALVRSRWQNAVDHYLPEIRRELALKRPSFPELGGNRSLTLVQL